MNNNYNFFFIIILILNEDIWALGCIFAELLITKPLFQGKEVKEENNQNPFQHEQIMTISAILGPPTTKVWPQLTMMPDYHKFETYRRRLVL